MKLRDPRRRALVCAAIDEMSRFGLVRWRFPVFGLPRTRRHRPFDWAFDKEIA